MSAKNWLEIETLFHTALDLNVKERGEYLTHCCAGDDALRREVESLLAAVDTRNEFLEQPVFETGIGLMARSDKASLTGKTIGSYVIQEKIGAGGMGEVYLAEDTQLNRKVALKFLSQTFVNDKWAKRQLIKEARAAAMLDNRNICAVYGFEEVGEYSFIVMQYVAGQTLAELIAKGALSQAEVVSIAGQILGALAVAHAHGIIHRDIKPSNIIVTPDKEAKVLDFGLAKLIHPVNSPAGLKESTAMTSQNGFIAGTVAYMSPEQLRGEKLDFRSDIFSFGILLFELVAGARPFDRESDAETISAILRESPQPLKSSFAAASGIERLIYKCLEKNKQQRYQSASEILLDLQNPVAAGWTARLFAFHKKRLLALLLSLTLLISTAFYSSDISSYLWKNKARSLAVLPVVNETSESGLDNLSDYMTKRLINRLSESSEFSVKFHSDVSDSKNKPSDYSEIAQKLKVENLLVTKFIERDGRVFLHSTLINVVDDVNFWSEEIIIDFLDYSSIAEQISDKVLLQLALYKNIGFAQQDETQNLEAYRNYRLGSYYWRYRWKDKENLSKSMEAFSKAIEIDPSYARAYAGLTYIYIVRSNPAYGAAPAREAMEKAKELAKKAMSLDYNSSESHAAMAVVLFRYQYQWKEAELEFKRAIELNPRDAQARQWYSDYLSTLGRIDEALTEAEIARQLEPFTPSVILQTGRVLYYGRRYDEAFNYFSELINKDRNNSRAKYMLALIYVQKRMYQEAIVLLEQLLDTEVKDWILASLGYTYGKAGRPEDARRLLLKMDEVYPHGVPPQEKSLVHIGLGEIDAAIGFLRDARKNRLPTLTGIIAEPLYDDLRSDERFKDLLFYMDYH